jgi:hypothetical protein
MQQQTCPICDSNDVSWRRRRPTDLPLSWGRYVVDFVVFSVISGGGQVHRQGANLPAGYYQPASMDMANRHDLSAAMRESNNTHRAMATPRWFWKCRGCKKRGAIYDDYVLREGS